MGASVTLATALLAQLEKDPNDPTVDTCRSNLQLVAVAMDEVAAKRK